MCRQGQAENGPCEVNADSNQWYVLEPHLTHLPQPRSLQSTLSINVASIPVPTDIEAGTSSPAMEIPLHLHAANSLVPSAVDDKDKTKRTFLPLRHPRAYVGRQLSQSIRRVRMCELNIE
jgi:hypothetical protein